MQEQPQQNINDIIVLCLKERHGKGTGNIIAKNLIKNKYMFDTHPNIINRWQNIDDVEHFKITSEKLRTAARILNNAPTTAKGHRDSFELIMGVVRTEKCIRRLGSHLTGIKRGCAVCGDNDSIKHILYECSPARYLWSALELFCYTHLNIYMKVDLQFSVLGLLEKSIRKYIGKQDKRVVFTLGMICRQIIYAMYYIRDPQQTTIEANESLNQAYKELNKMRYQNRKDRTLNNNLL